MLNFVYCRLTIYTFWTAPSLTFDLLCRSRLMLDEAKLSPTSASTCTTNRMLGEALSNKCFVMPKSLNDNIKNWVCFGQILSCSDDKHFQVNYILNTHARWISNLLLCADWLIDSPEKIFFGFEILSSAPKARTEKKFLPWVCIILASGSFVLVTKRFVKPIES